MTIDTESYCVVDGTTVILYCVEFYEATTYTRGNPTYVIVNLYSENPKQIAIMQQCGLEKDRLKARIKQLRANIKYAENVIKRQDTIIETESKRLFDMHKQWSEL